MLFSMPSANPRIHKSLISLWISPKVESLSEVWKQEEKNLFVYKHFISIITKSDTITASYILFVFVLINMLQLQTDLSQLLRFV